MPRYLIERSEPERLRAPVGMESGDPWADLVETNSRHGVTWLHSYVAVDRSRSYCICDAPTPEAVRAASRHTGLPVDRITEIRVVDPYLQT